MFIVFIRSWFKAAIQSKVASSYVATELLSTRQWGSVYTQRQQQQQQLYKSTIEAEHLNLTIDLIEFNYSTNLIRYNKSHYK